MVKRTSLHIKGVDESTAAESLKNAFGKYGEVRDVYIPRDYYTKEMRGFAYVEFANPEDAEHAFSKIEYLTVNNRKLTVEWARGERQMPQTMRARERRGGDRDRYRPRDRSRSYDRGYDRRNRSRDRSYDRHKKDRSDDRDRRRSRSRSPHPPSDRRGSYDRRDR